jgi:hypothetical protein
MFKIFKCCFHTFFCFIFLFFISGPRLTIQAADYYINLDYGKVKPIEAISLSRTIPAAIGVQKADGILVDFNPVLTGPEQRTLPSKRLKLFANRKLFQFTGTPLTIPFSDTVKNRNIIGLAFDLNVNPQDYPGKYEGKVIIRPWVEGPQGREWDHTITIRISVQIQPWVRIEALQNTVSLEDASGSNSQIQNTQPLVLRIASNSNWILFSGTDPESPQTVIQPEIVIQPRGDPSIQITPVKSAGFNNRKNMASGGSTTAAGGYWLELNLMLIIGNFTKYVSGKHTIPLQFTVELRDGPSG